MMQLEFYQRSVVSYKQWKCLNETVAVWLQQVFIDIDAEDVVDFFAARVTSQNVASRTKKSWRKERMDWVCVRYTCIPESRENLVRISWESRENLVRISWEAHETTALSWESREKISASWESHENLMRIQCKHQSPYSEFSWENAQICSWESRDILMRFSWESVPIFTWKKDSRESHEKLKRNLMRSSWKLENLMRKRSNFHVKTKISWDSHEIWWKAHEILMRIVDNFHFLMRISWDSHEYSWEFL